SVLATDVDFGMDGALYFTDWVEGWEKTGKGRIYKVFDPEHVKDSAVQSVRQLMAEGFSQRSLAELAKLLEHPYLRVRQEAQFALAEKGNAVVPVLAAVACTNKLQLARLHGIWGLGQLGRKETAALDPVLELTADGDTEVRAQAAKVLGDDRLAKGSGRLVTL